VANLVELNLKRTYSAQANYQIVAPKCGVCGDETGSRSKVYCVECEENLCEICSIRCKKWKGGAHRLRQLTDGDVTSGPSSRAMNCDQHSAEKVTNYCSECKINVCSQCIAAKHRKHKCIEIGEAAAEFSKRIENTVDILSRMVVQIEKKRQDLETNREISYTYAEVTPKTGEKSVSADAIQTAEKQQDAESAEEKSCTYSEVSFDKNTGLKQVHKVKSEAEKHIIANLDGIELTLVAIESFVNYAQQMKDKGSPYDITRTACDLNTRASELKKMATDTVGDFMDDLEPGLTFRIGSKDKRKSGGNKTIMKTTKIM